MIKSGNAAMQMFLKSGLAKTEKEAVTKIQSTIATTLERNLSYDQIREFIEKNLFKEDEMEAICAATGYTLAYIPIKLLKDVPIT